MFFSSKSKEVAAPSKNDLIVSALCDQVAFIEFDPSGNVFSANTLFCNAVGYTVDEIRGKHHQMFCPSHVKQSKEYSSFWQDLSRGQKKNGVFERVKKDGSLLILEATYFPVKTDGVVTSVVKIASDITEMYQKNQHTEALVNALNKSFAVIEFEPDGKIISANQNFLSALGYSADQVKGKHHKMFCDDSFYRENPSFWQDLSKGHFQSGRFLRKDSSGNDVWIEATYNPILDAEGKVYRVIKFATDITENVKKELAVTDAANIAHSTALQTSKVAQKGKNVLGDSVSLSSSIVTQIQETLTKITKLNDLSKEVSDIVQVISGIAEQTNLLALNAAIEAARAGEQGRGFAVVADEVRQLASRTSSATEEINSVVARNISLTEEVTVSNSEVSKIANDSNEKIVEASTIMEEIHLGADNVSSAVGGLIEQ